MQSQPDAIGYSEEFINQHEVKARFENLLTQMQDLMEAGGMLDYASVNTDLLGLAILSYFEDVDRLKEYEGIDRINVEKIYAYEAFWLLRMKPIQVTGECPNGQSPCVNEKVVCGMLVAKMLREMGLGHKDLNARIASFMDLLFYTFKYRTFTQKTLELMVSAFFCGCLYLDPSPREGAHG